MALKLKKYPKAPKRSASLTVVENYLQKCRLIDKDNNKIKADEKKRIGLLKKVQDLKRKK